MFLQLVLKVGKLLGGISYSATRNWYVRTFRVPRGKVDWNREECAGTSAAFQGSTPRASRVAGDLAICLGGWKVMRPVRWPENCR